MKASGYIVIYDDDDCLCIPQRWDADCEGAISCGNGGDPVAVFGTRARARTAINVSARFAALCKAQGKPANDDYLPPCRKNIRIVALAERAKGGGR